MGAGFKIIPGEFSGGLQANTLSDDKDVSLLPGFEEGTIDGGDLFPVFRRQREIWVTFLHWLFLT